MTDPLDRLRRQAKALRRDDGAGDPRAAARLAAHPPRPKGADLAHADYLHVIAREQGFASWPDLKAAVEIEGMDRAQKRQRLQTALIHGQPHIVTRLLADVPDLADGLFGAQVALLDRAAVADALAKDPGLATKRVAGRTPILHLAFSRMIHVWPDRRGDMLAIADLLVAQGADVNDAVPVEGSDHRLSALYGAIGHAQNIDLAAWLLDHGADPNDGESLYHATELGDREGLRLLLAHGARTEGTNALPRALDFNDHAAVQMLLDAGADPNEFNSAPVGSEAPVVIPALHQAARRMCDGDMIDLLLAGGADPALRWNGRTAAGYAAIYGNRAALDRFDALGHRPDLSAEETLLARAAAVQETDGAFIDPAKLDEEARSLLQHILHLPGKLDHVKRLVALGLEYDRVDPVDRITPVQVAGWNGLPDMMGYLLSLGPDLSFVNGYGGTLLSTIIHGSEHCPERAGRAHVACARMALEHGVALPRRAVELAGDPDMRALLSDWASAHPGAVIESGFA